MAINLNGILVKSQKDLFNTSDTSNNIVPSAFRELANMRTQYEPQRGNHFEFLLDFGDNNKLLRWGEATDTIIGRGNDKYFYGVDNILRVSLDQAFLPDISVDTINVKRGNSDIVFAGTPKVGHSGTLNFNDWIGTRTYDVLLAWFQLVYNLKTDKVGLASDYKRTAHVFQYTPTWQLVRAWSLEGVFPTSVKGGQLSYSTGGNEIMKVEAAMSYDTFSIDYDVLQDTISRAETIYS